MAADVIAQPESSFFIGPDQPSPAHDGPYVWLEVDENADYSLWIEDTPAAYTADQKGLFVGAAEPVGIPGPFMWIQIDGADTLVWVND